MREGTIQENIKAVEDRIAAECQKAGRDPEDVTLIAVSKTKPVEMLREAYEYGCRDFGENKVQELLDKYEEMPRDIRWHMIGHLQRNKVKNMVDKVYLIHSVDSLRLAEEISKEAVKKNVCVNILVEVNVANEETKFGTTCEEVKQLVQDMAKHGDIMDENIDNITMENLSMGMTGDYTVAVSEGATYVRVGTGIFGVRQYMP